MHNRRLFVTLLLLVLPLLVAISPTGCDRTENAAGKIEGVNETNIGRLPAASDLMQRANDCMQRGQSQEALQLLAQILSTQPENPQALMLAVKIHASRNEFAKAADYGARLAVVKPEGAVALLVSCFDWNLRSGRYQLAETNLLAAIEMAPHDIEARRFLVQLYNSQGRRVETREHVLALIRRKAVAWPEILSLIDLRGPYTLVSFGDAIDESEVSLFWLGKMRTSYAGFDSTHDEVIATMQRVLKVCPRSTAASAFYGRLLIENGRHEQLMDWLANTPVGIEQQPEYWTTLGSWLQQNERDDEAIRAFAEALKLDAGNREALRDIIVSLDKTGAEPQAVTARKQLAVLDQIFRNARDADAEQSMWIASELQKLMRPWEALAWMMHSAQLQGNLRQIIPELERRATLVTQWETSTTADLLAKNRVEKLLGFNLDDWPLPNLDPISPGKVEAIVSGSDDANSSSLELDSVQRVSTLQFTDIARDVNLNSDTRTGFFDRSNSFFAYQVDGSGIAVLDFDLDGRPDVYVMQSNGPPNDSQGSDPNQLLRQLPSHAFIDVTSEAETADRNYGAGVAVGDLNQDGFPDLLLGNVGASVVFINQGDGTFRDASSLIKVNASVWTSSFAIADLSGDHLPEIIQVNYIDDATAFEIKCSGGYLLCQPQRFQAATDRVLKGNEDGTFSTWKSITTIADNPKLGLGVIVANFDKQHGNDVFVANDGDLNHYWTSTPGANADESFTMIESAGLRGCSIGQGGTSQACMGIAAGDFNRDGLLDMYVTNFYHEPVNLFIQNRLGFFSDQATRYGLNAVSMPVLGFGTQARDFDNDGWLDLATLNGHVYDASDQGVPFRMKAQLMKGSQSGFTLEQADVVGTYWQREHLGRALATWDWNGDGRMDLIANHLDQPIAVLQNDSKALNWLQLELVGTLSERDAIGAEVTVTAGSESWTAFRTAGDGYMVSNEPILHFGIGKSESLDRVEIRWPSGRTESFQNVRANARYLLVEGATELHQRDQHY